MQHNLCWKDNIKGNNEQAKLEKGIELYINEEQFTCAHYFNGLYQELIVRGLTGDIAYEIKQMVSVCMKETWG